MQNVKCKIGEIDKTGEFMKNIFSIFEHFYEHSNEKLRFRDIMYFILELLA